jgi:hypothetical protein
MAGEWAWGWNAVGAIGTCAVGVAAAWIAWIAYARDRDDRMEQDRASAAVSLTHITDLVEHLSGLRQQNKTVRAHLNAAIGQAALPQSVYEDFEVGVVEVTPDVRTHAAPEYEQLLTVNAHQRLLHQRLQGLSTTMSGMNGFVVLDGGQLALAQAEVAGQALRDYQHRLITRRKRLEKLARR